MGLYTEKQCYLAPRGRVTLPPLQQDSKRSALMGSSFPIETAPADVEPGDLEELVSKRYIEKTYRSRVKGTVRVWSGCRRQRNGEGEMVTQPKWQNELPFTWLSQRPFGP
jgi:hypothetical protein